MGGGGHLHFIVNKKWDGGTSSTLKDISRNIFFWGGGGGHFKYVKVYVTVYQVENANVSTILMHITYRFLKRAPHEGANLLSIDTVPCDGHQMTSTRHDVTKQS